MSTLNETLNKIRFLKELQTHTWDLHKIPLARQTAYAQAMAGRPPSESRRRKDDTQLLEVICFLRMRLLELTDSALYQTGRRISDFARQASGKTQARQAQRSGNYRESLVSIKQLVDDNARPAEERLAAIAVILTALGGSDAEYPRMSSSPTMWIATMCVEALKQCRTTASISLIRRCKRTMSFAANRKYPNHVPSSHTRKKPED